MTVQLYNFKKPGRLPHDVEQRFISWIKIAADLAVNRCRPLFPFPLEFQVQLVDSAFSQDVLAGFPETGIGYRFTLQESMPALVGGPRPLLLGLIAGLMGETPTQFPDDRDLTPIEESLAQFLVQTLLLGPFQETWQGRDTLSATLGPREQNLRWSRFFPPGSAMQWCQMLVKTPFGAETLGWLMLQENLLKLMGGTDVAAASQRLSAEVVRGRLEGLVREMPVEVAVQLGAVAVPLQQLAQLQAGDVLVLDQKVAEPLAATIAGEKKLRGWPGRIASRQAFRLESFKDA